MANRLSDVDWFMWNGIKSTTYGIHVLNQPTFTSPKERYSSVSVPGKAGSLIVTEGDNIYENVIISVNCICDDIFWQTHDYDIYGYVSGNGFSTKDILRTYLSGTGNLTFPLMHQDDMHDLPIRRDFYKARLLNQIDFGQVVAGNPHRTFQLTFECEPFVYLEWGNVEQQLVLVGYDESQNPIYQHDFPNEGNMHAKPTLAIISSGVPIQLRSIKYGTGELLQVMDIAAIPASTIYYIDCDVKTVYSSDNVLLTGYVSGDWLEIPVGTGIIQQIGETAWTSVYPHYRRV